MPWTALDYITIKGFKSIASIEKLELRPINVVIGANGSGKSNFLGAFSFLRTIADGRLQNLVAAAGGAENVLHFGSKVTKEICFQLSFAEGEYELNLAPTYDDGLFPAQEIASGREIRPLLPLGFPERHEAGISNEYRDGPLKWLRDRLISWRLYHVHDTSSSSPMRKTAKVDDNDILRPDGSNLAAFLYLLQEMHPMSYGMIRRTVQLVAPFFDDFRLRPLKLNPADIKLEWRHRNSEKYFDASSLSDGTLRFIALATLFLQPAEFRPFTILVDEPELGLHPFAIGLLASLIRQVSVETQVIVSTQSSLLLDHFAAEDVLVANRVEGGTRIERLDPERLQVWLEEYSLGQLWEKNELGGRPVLD